MFTRKLLSHVSGLLKSVLSKLFTHLYLQEDEEEDVRNYWMTFKDRRGYSHLKAEALDPTMWKNRFCGGVGPVIRQNTEWMNFIHYYYYWAWGKIVVKALHY
jgi:hypothetical protein